GGDSVEFKNIEKVFASNTENKALVQSLFYAYVFEQVTGRKQLEPHLYVARRMREEGTLFRERNDLLTAEKLHTAKADFETFLRSTLSEYLIRTYHSNIIQLARYTPPIPTRYFIAMQ